MPNIRRWANQETPEFIADVGRSHEQTVAYLARIRCELPSLMWISFAISGGGKNVAHLEPDCRERVDKKGDRPKFRWSRASAIGYQRCSPSSDRPVMTSSRARTRPSPPRMSSPSSQCFRYSAKRCSTDNARLAKCSDRWFRSGFAGRGPPCEHAGRGGCHRNTDLDAQRLVIWDMGAIASSGNPASWHCSAKSCWPPLHTPGYFRRSTYCRRSTGKAIRRNACGRRRNVSKFSCGGRTSICWAPADKWASTWPLRLRSPQRLA